MDAECRPGMAAFRADLFAVLPGIIQLPEDGAAVVFFRTGRVDVGSLGAPQGHAVDSSDLRLDRVGPGIAGLLPRDSGVAYLCAGGDYIHYLGIRTARETSLDPAARRA